MTHPKLEPGKARETDSNMLTSAFAFAAALFLASWFILEVLRGLDTGAALTWALIMATAVFIFEVLAKQLATMSGEVRKALGVALIALIAAFALAPQPKTQLDMDYQFFVDVFESSSDFDTELEPDPGWHNSVPSGPTTNPGQPSGPEDFCNEFHGINAGNPDDDTVLPGETRMGPAVKAKFLLDALDQIRELLCTDAVYLYDLGSYNSGGYGVEVSDSERKNGIAAIEIGSSADWSATAARAFLAINSGQARVVEYVYPIEMWGHEAVDGSRIPALTRGVSRESCMVLEYVNFYDFTYGAPRFLCLDGGAAPANP